MASFFEQARNATQTAAGFLSKFFGPGKQEVAALNFLKQKEGPIKPSDVRQAQPLATLSGAPLIGGLPSQLAALGSEELVVKPFARAAASVLLSTKIAQDNSLSIPKSPFARSVFGEGIAGEGSGVLSLQETNKRVAEGEGFGGQISSFIEEKTGIPAKFTALPVVGLFVLSDLFPGNPLKARVALESPRVIKKLSTLGDEAVEIGQKLLKGEDISKYPKNLINDVRKVVDEFVMLEPLEKAAKEANTLEEFLKKTDEVRKIDVGIAKRIDEVTQGRTSFNDIADFYKRSNALDIDEAQALALRQLRRGDDAIDVRKAFNINKNRLKISDEALRRLDDVVEEILPNLKAIKGKTMTKKEVMDTAEQASAFKKVVNRAETLEFNARLTKTRADLAKGLEEKTLTADTIENLRVVSSLASDAGRKLQNFSHTVNGQSFRAAVKEDLVKELIKLGKSTDEILKAAEGVDFTNPKQVTEFYRKFKPARLTEILDEMRYASLLSNPKTHEVNFASNLLQTVFLKPSTKLITGGIDWVASGLTKSERKVYAKEVSPLYKGYANAMPDAIEAALDVIRGNRFVERPDLARIETGKNPFQFILRALEAGDIFFRHLLTEGEKAALYSRAVKNGEKLTEVKKAKLDKQAMEDASYWIFRAPLDTKNIKGQGQLLSAIDRFTEAVLSIRKVKGLNWVVPFVSTPMNILKQGVEFSPLGFATMVGNSKKTEQFAKAALGSGVFAGAGLVGQMTDLTWAAPRGEKERQAFYAVKQPYSIKIGDEYVSYSKLGPLAYPMALAAAWKYNNEVNPKTKDEAYVKKFAATIGSIGQFFSDQSYLASIGELIDVVQGRMDPTNYITSLGRQAIPLNSLMGAVARTIDPIFRDAQTPVEEIMVQIPFLSSSVTPHTDPAGEPSKRPEGFLRAISPLKSKPKGTDFIDELFVSRSARAIWQDLRDMPDRELAQSMLNKIKKERPELISQIKKEQKWDKLGITAQERKLSNLGIKNGSRAKAIARELHNLDTRKQKNALLKKLRSAGIINPEVEKQLRTFFGG